MYAIIYLIIFKNISSYSNSSYSNRIFFIAANFDSKLFWNFSGIFNHFLDKNRNSCCYIIHFNN